jgi:hypothetical protein
MTVKVCPECGEKIIGRSDKKFCSDLCRNAYNNKLNTDATNFVRNINNALRKNTRSHLFSEGFDFTYFTSIRKTQKGSVYHFVYDFGYLELENDFFLVVKDNRG